MKYLLFIAIVSVCACGTTSHRVEYRITGTTGNVDVTLMNASGGIEQINIKPPYTLAFAASTGQAIYLSGQNKWDAGAVTCAILIDDQVVQTATTATPYGVVTCRGSI